MANKTGLAVAVVVESKMRVSRLRRDSNNNNNRSCRMPDQVACEAFCEVLKGKGREGFVKSRRRSQVEAEKSSRRRAGLTGVGERGQKAGRGDEGRRKRCVRVSNPCLGTGNMDGGRGGVWSESERGGAEALCVEPQKQSEHGPPEQISTGGEPCR